MEAFYRISLQYNSVNLNMIFSNHFHHLNMHLRLLFSIENEHQIRNKFKWLEKQAIEIINFKFIQSDYIYLFRDK